MNSQETEEDKEWVKYQEDFHRVYDQSNYSSPLQSSVMRASHKFVEREFSCNHSFEQVLEVGAGTGEHLKFVKHNYSQYIISDLNKDALRVAEKKLTPSLNQKQHKVTYEVQNSAKLTYPDNSFDRLIAVHILEHINNPHLALKEWERVVKSDGIISILIPTDPGFAWRLGRHFGPRKRALKKGIPYDYIMAREHVNSCNNLISLIRHYFNQRRESWWPLRIPSVDANLFFACNILIKK